MKQRPSCDKRGQSRSTPPRITLHRVAAQEREREFDGPDTTALVCPDCVERAFGEL
jgi:hypothetical protein